jgi:HAD superfamily phosphoserine phosphatase-like hydrolase
VTPPARDETPTAPSAPWAVFADYDGTITDLDTFDVLVRRAAGPGPWHAIERRLAAGELTLRAALEEEASYVRETLDEADARLLREITFDRSFVDFATHCERTGIPLTVLSSGIEPLIRRMLARHGLSHLPVIANDIEVRPEGWTILFNGEHANGTDKAGIVAEAKAGGATTVFIGDGRSDFDAALCADVRFAKRGSALERHLLREALEFTPFERFSDLLDALAAARARRSE